MFLLFGFFFYFFQSFERHKRNYIHTHRSGVEAEILFQWTQLLDF